MLRDIAYMMVLSIKEWGKNASDFQKKKPIYRKTKFKISILLLMLLWIVSASNIIYGLNDEGYRGRIVSAFSNDTYDKVSASLSYYGKYADAVLAEDAKVIILEHIAKAIKINRYEITNTFDEEDNTVTTLSQLSEAGDVIMKFITHDKDKQYIYVGININKQMDAIFTYEDILKKELDKLGMDNTTVAINVKGEMNGELEEYKKDSITKMLLDKTGAKVVTGHKSDELYTIYAYDKDIKEGVELGEGKVNVNISIEYNSDKNKTIVYYSVPYRNM